MQEVTINNTSTQTVPSSDNKKDQSNPSTSSLHPKIPSKDFSILQKLLIMMTSLEKMSKRATEEMLFVLCDEDSKSILFYDDE